MKKNQAKLCLKILTAASLLVYLLIVLVFIPVLINNEVENRFAIFLYGYLFLTIVVFSVIGPLFLWDFQSEKRNYVQTLIFSIVVLSTQIPLVGLLGFGLSQYSTWSEAHRATQNDVIIEAILLSVTLILIAVGVVSLIVIKKPTNQDAWDSIVIEIEKRSNLSMKKAKQDFQEFKSNLK